MKYLNHSKTSDMTTPIITIPNETCHIITIKCKMLTLGFLNFNKESISLKMKIIIFPKLHMFLQEIQIINIQIILDNFRIKMIKKLLISQNIKIGIRLTFKYLFIKPNRVPFSKIKIVQQSRLNRIHIIKNCIRRFKKIAKESHNIVKEIKKIRPQD